VLTVPRNAPVDKIGQLSPQLVTFNLQRVLV